MQDEKKNTREKIFEAAVRLFAAKGFHATSMRDLGRAVGIKESSLYNHFSGKDAILDSILEYQIEAFQFAEQNIDIPELSDPGINDAVTLWMAGVRAYIEFQAPLSELISRIFLNEMFLHAGCRKFVLEMMFNYQKNITEKLLTILRQRGLIKDIDIRETALQYVHMVHGMDVENRLLLLEGRDPLELREKMFISVRHFIQEISKK